MSDKGVTELQSIDVTDLEAARGGQLRSLMGQTIRTPFGRQYAYSVTHGDRHSPGVSWGGHLELGYHANGDARLSWNAPFGSPPRERRLRAVGDAMDWQIVE
jgi:hypothetical protein